MPADPVNALAAALAAAAGAELELERPAEAEHGDYATNVALQLAGTRRRPPREHRGRDRGGGRRAGRGRARRGRGAGLRQPLPARRVVRGGARRDARGRRGVRRRRPRAAGARAGRDGLRQPDGADPGLVGSQRRLRRLASPVCSSSRATRSSASTTTTTRARRSTASARRSRPSAGARSRPRTATTARTSTSSPRLQGDPVPLMLKEIETTLERFRIHFDSFRLQSELEQRLPELLPKLDTYEKDGALWARSSAYGDDEDRVLLRSEDRSPTYRAADVAYLVDKLERGFDRAIYVLGADHHGTRNWYAAVARMLGYDPERVEVAPLPARSPDEGRRADEDVEAARRRRLPRRVHGRDRRRRRALVSRRTAAPTRRSRSTSTSPPSGRRRTPSTTSSTRMRGSPGSSATRATRRSSAEHARPLAPEERELVKRLAELPARHRGRAREARPAGDPGLRDPRRRRLPPLLPRAPRARERAARRSGSASAARRRR